MIVLCVDMNRVPIRHLMYAPTLLTRPGHSAVCPDTEEMYENGRDVRQQHHHPLTSLASSSSVIRHSTERFVKISWSQHQLETSFGDIGCGYKPRRLDSASVIIRRVRSCSESTIMITYE